MDPKGINYVAFAGGGELLPQVLGNQVSAGVSGYGEFKGQVDAGALRILAVSGDQRIAGVERSNAEGGRRRRRADQLARHRRPAGHAATTPGRAGSTMLTRMHDSQAWQDTLQKNDWADAFSPATSTPSS